MSGRVTKRAQSQSLSAKERKFSLLSTILQNSIEMSPCTFCQSRGLESCQVSPNDSSRCAECVRLNRSSCDVAGVSTSQLRRIATQHQKLEEELERAEEKVLRLRKQKKLWFEKMIRAVSRGIDTVEELERVEKEEAEREASRQREAEVVGRPVGRSSTEGLVSADFELDWTECFGQSPLEPALMEDFSVAALSYGTASGAAERPSGSS
jgi:hypothetical protein